MSMTQDIDDLIGRLDEYTNHTAPVAEEICHKAAAVLSAQQAEIARITDWSKATFEAGFQAMQRAERAEAERDAAMKDAERYRWLRENWTTMTSDVLNGNLRFFTKQKKWINLEQPAIDAAIDAAMKANAMKEKP